MSGQEDRYTKRTLGQLLNDSAVKFAAREAWVFKDERVNYRELRDKVDRLAGGLLRLGIARGDKVAVWMPNCLEWVYAYLAVAKIGAALVPVNTRFKPQEAGYILRHSDASTLIITDKFLKIDFISMAHELCPELVQAQQGRLNSASLPKLRNVICLAENHYDGMYRFDDIIALGNDFPRDDLMRVEAAVDPDEPLIILYTSGTTGFPKGVMHSHKIIRNMTDAAARLGMTEQDCIVLYVPLFHVYGTFSTVLNCLITGARVVMMGTYEVAESLHLMAKERATIVYSMDTMYFDQLRHPDFDRLDLTSLRTGVCPGGAPNLAPLMREVITRMCKIRSGYGMTETTSLTSLTLQDDSIERVCSTSGYPLPGFDIKIIDPQTGQQLPPNNIGEICVRGHPVMLGYYKNPEDTNKAIDGEGWFHTGDLCAIDDQGYIRFARRLREIFRVGGENADPVEVETLLLQHPAIAMARVTGVPDKRLGEVCAAFVQFKNNNAATEQEIIDFCKGKIANFKVPRYVLAVDEYPMTANGKVQKFRLREIAVEQLALEGD